MRLAVVLLCIGLVQYALAQNTAPNDFGNFGIFSSGGSGSGGGTALGGTAQTPTLLGGSQDGFSNGLNQNQFVPNNIGTVPGQQAIAGQPIGMNQGMNPGMGQQGFGAQNTQMMNPNGMQMPGQNGMQGGLMQGGMQQGMNTMQGGMQQGMNALQGGMQQGMNTMQGGMQQGMNTMQGGMQQGMPPGMMDPTRLGMLNNGGNFNNQGFDISQQDQRNLFQNQLTAQNTPQFQNGQMNNGQGQFGGQTPFGQQGGFQTGGQFPGQFPGQQMQFGQFASPFTSRPSPMGPFPDPMMNAFAPQMPQFMPQRPMMMPGPFMMPGMQMSNTIFDANGNPVGSFGASQQGNSFSQGSGLDPMGSLTQSGAFGQSTLIGSPMFGQMQQQQFLSQQQMPGFQPPFAAGGRQQGLPGRILMRNAGFNQQQTQGSGMQSQNNMRASNNQLARNSFAISTNGRPVNGNIQPFSGIVPHQPSTKLSNTGNMVNGMINTNNAMPNSAMSNNGMSLSNNAMSNNGMSNTAMSNNDMSITATLNTAPSQNIWNTNTNGLNNGNTALNTNNFISGAGSAPTDTQNAASFLNNMSSSSIFATAANTNTDANPNNGGSSTGLNSFSSFSGKK